ncbi:hypothetical protein [Bosea sp. (in: a-proteobacteria)]|uniref:hypothetical protein n=1 Tax=Bosea sp. (in: a-proteobacteria) TaxID=1871050 RepID=UPI0012035111|nr:hypothetical protein [Bosea sp. (in: a-proteobacteria)]TAJ29335.1 MAG: hypothetical protein EPO59_15310 [Bosea sp. (in: a-proteobacteria)]
MYVFRLILRELFGMFVDDEFLALSILGVIATAAVASTFEASSSATGLILVIGCVGVLTSSVLKASRKR